MTNLAVTGHKSPDRDAQTTNQITGPHLGRDATGEPYDYYRCENCGAESTDERMASDGCFRCNGT